VNKEKFNRLIQEKKEKADSLKRFLRGQRTLNDIKNGKGYSRI